jgi:hypothetical protein
MRRAIQIGRYLLAHARSALAQMGADPLVADAQHILDHLRRCGAGHITRRDLHRAVRGRFERAANLEAPLALLAEHGWIRIRTPERRGAGRKASPDIEIHPDAQTYGQNGHIGHSPPAPDDSGNRVHSVPL